MKREGWRRLSAPGDKCSTNWVHNASGWEIQHCGHPTANWPYYALDPSYPGTATVTHNGLGFRTLRQAMEAIEHVLAGRWRATNENCFPSVRRIISPEQERPQEDEHGRTTET